MKLWLFSRENFQYSMLVFSQPQCACNMAHFNLIVSFSSISTVSCLEDPGPHDENARMPITKENTYQLGEPTFTCTINTLHKRKKIRNHCSYEQGFGDLPVGSSDMSLWIKWLILASKYLSVVLDRMHETPIDWEKRCFPHLFWGFFFGPQDPTNASLFLRSQTYWRMFSPVTSKMRNTKQSGPKKWQKQYVR